MPGPYRAKDLKARPFMLPGIGKAGQPGKAADVSDYGLNRKNWLGGF